MMNGKAIPSVADQIADRMDALASEIGSRVMEGGVGRERYYRLRQLASEVRRLESHDAIIKEVEK